MTGLIADQEGLFRSPKGIKESVLFHIKTVQKYFQPLLQDSDLKCQFRIGGQPYSCKELLDFPNWGELRKKMKDNKVGLCLEVFRKESTDPPILIHVFVRQSEDEVDDYPRYHIPVSLLKDLPESAIMGTVRGLLAKERIHFCILPLRRDEPFLFWADLYSSIAEENQRLTSRFLNKRKDRLITLVAAGRGKYMPIDRLIPRLNKLIEHNKAIVAEANA
jgi:hypothetical protein